MGELSLWPASACLVTELAAELDALSADELRRTTVLLPTKRLGVWLLALLSERRAAFVPPILKTWDEWIDRTAPAGADDALAPLSPLAEELLLATLLKEKKYKHLKLGYEHEIRQLFTELTEWNLENEAFPALHQVIRGNAFLSEGGLDTLSERVTELEDLCRRWRSAARELAAEPQATRSARRSRALADALDAMGPAAEGRLYVVGFSSLSGLHWPLFGALARRPETRIWLSEPPQLATEQNPLALMLAAAGVDARHRAPTYASPQAPVLEVHRAGTVLEEVAHALALVQDAIERGLKPSAIALLVTNDAAYGKPLRALLRGSGLTANVALAAPLADTAVGSWFQALIEMLRQGEAVAEVLAVATHPLTLAWWQTERPGGEPPGVLRERLARDVAEAGVDRGLAWMAGARHLPPETKDFLDALIQLLRPLKAEGPGPRPLSFWTEGLSTLLNTVVLPHAARILPPDDLGIAQSTVDGLQAFARELAALAERHDAPLRSSEFLALLQDKLLSLDVRSVGDPLAGLQVLSIAEARYVPFARVVVLGCVEGDFPRALPKDHLVDNFLRSRIGLPGWRLLEAIEDTTFHLLSARLPELLLLYPETRGGERAVRSRFIETALVTREGLREQAAARLPELLTLLAAASRAPEAPRRFGASRRLGPAGRSRQPATELLATLSASSLENLIRCPYRFLLGRLGVEEASLPGDDEARQEGDWLHDVLQAFFTGKTGARELDGGLVPPAWGDFEAYALARLHALTDELTPGHLKGSPLALQVRLYSWPAFVRHLMKIYTPETLHLMNAGLREFDVEAPVKGRIDSVDRLGGLHLVTDYKRSGTPEKGAVKSGLAPQLLLYAQALEAKQELPLAQAVVGYWSILKGHWQDVLAGSGVVDEARQRGLIAPREKETLEDAVARLTARWQARLSEVEASGFFRPDPSECGFCAFAGICRRDDPELGPRLAEGPAPEAAW